MNQLEQLPNIGPDTAKQLNEIGIYTAGELKKLGSMAAWLRIKKIDSSACYNRLCGLEGAIQGIRWHNLDDQIKQRLKEFYNVYK